LTVVMQAVTLALVASVLALWAPASAWARQELSVGDSVVVGGTEGRGMRLRAGPGMSHKILATIPEGSTVRVLGGPVADGDDDWYQVRSGASLTGWAVGRYLLPQGGLESLATDEGGQRSFVAKLTAYANGVGGVPKNARTASGTETRWGVVAVDPKVIPLGSQLTIEGYDGVFVAEDTGGAIKGTAIDIWLPDPNDARRFGTQYRKVTVIREGPAR
jgi:3D (Asp-Asp-Asp) domain-containing protein